MCISESLFICDSMNLLYIILLALWSYNTRSFLIYNEDHNKCLKAITATIVLAVQCDASSEKQHFQWISSSQIISLSFGLCLGAETIEDRVKVFLLPCNKINPAQTWECKNETLFGLKGHSLHLNYGHRNDSNVMLYVGTGEWSRWLVYRTKENLCSQGHQETYSVGGNSFGKPCQFPFRYRKKWYADCTTDGRTDGQLWCSTERDYNTDGQWGFCPPKDINITVFRQEDRDHVIVKCTFGRKLNESSFQLLLEDENNYTLKNPLCCTYDVCVFDVKVSPPISFTCVHKIHSVMNHQSERFTYSPSDHHEGGISFFYICFFSFICVSLFIMTAAVILTTITSNAKGSVITGTANDYIDG